MQKSCCAKTRLEIEEYVFRCMERCEGAATCHEANPEALPDRELAGKICLGSSGHTDTSHMFDAQAIDLIFVEVRFRHNGTPISISSLVATRNAITILIWTLQITSESKLVIPDAFQKLPRLWADAFQMVPPAEQFMLLNHGVLLAFVLQARGASLKSFSILPLR